MRKGKAKMLSWIEVGFFLGLGLLLAACVVSIIANLVKWLGAHLRICKTLKEKLEQQRRARKSRDELIKHAKPQEWR